MSSVDYFMQRFANPFFSIIKRLVVCTVLVSLAACAHYEESGLPGSASAMARDKMMFVREEPPTFGYYRLNSLIRSYPDIDLFVHEFGAPDFMAETKHEDFEYLIFYYLEKRNAFVCKAKYGRQQQVKFAGPYPITDREVEMLDGFRKEQDL